MLKKKFSIYIIPTIIKIIGTTLVVVPITTYYLSPKDFGIIGILTAISVFITALSSTGANWVLGGDFYRRDSEYQNKIITHLLVIDLILKFFLCMLFIVLAKFFLPVIVKSFIDDFLPVFYLFCIAEFFGGFYSTFSYTLILQERPKALASIDIIQFISQASILFSLFYVGIKPMVVIPISLIFSGAIMCLMGIVFIRKNLIWKFDGEVYSSILSRGLPTISLNLFESLTTNVQRVFIERWTNLFVLGIYTHSLSYKNIFMQTLKAFSRAFSPGVLKLISQSEISSSEIKKQEKIFRQWNYLLGLGGVLVVLFGEFVIGIISHNKFNSAYPIVIIWYIQILIFSYGIPYNQMLLGLKKNKYILKTEIIIGMGFWIVGAVFTFYWGALGAGWSVVVYTAVLMLSRIVYLKKYLKMPLIDFQTIPIMIICIGIVFYLKNFL